jgi:hypothetical protein
LQRLRCVEFGNYIGGDLDSDDELGDEEIQQEQPVAGGSGAAGAPAPLEGYDEDADMMDVDGHGDQQVALAGAVDCG